MDELNNACKENLVQIIVKIIYEKGNGILSEENTLISLISDLYPNHQKVIFLLECLLKKTSLKFLWEASKKNISSYDLDVSVIKKDIQNSLSLDIKAIDWIFEVWKNVFESIENEQKPKLDEIKSNLYHEMPDKESLIIQSLKDEISKKEDIISKQKRIIEANTEINKKNSILNQEPTKKQSSIVPQNTNIILFVNLIVIIILLVALTFFFFIFVK